MPADKLTPKQDRFVQEYLIDLNATQAAIRAGYSKKTAKEIGFENLTKPHIAAVIADHQGKQLDRTELSARRVLEELGNIGLSDVRQVFDEHGQIRPPKDWPDAFAAAVSSVEVVERPTNLKNEDGTPKVELTYKVKLWSKTAAVETLARHFGLVRRDGPAVQINNTTVINEDHRTVVVQVRDELSELFEETHGQIKAPDDAQRLN